MSEFINSLSPEEVQSLVDNPGQNFSGAIGGAPTTITPTSSINIDEPASRGVRPQIGGHVSGKERIRTPSKNLARKLAEGGEKMRAEAEAQAAEEARLREEHSPTNLNSRIAFLERQLKKAMAEINKLKKEQ